MARNFKYDGVALDWTKKKRNSGVRPSDFQKTEECPVCGKYVWSTGFEKNKGHYFKHSRRIGGITETTYCYLPVDAI